MKKIFKLLIIGIISFTFGISSVLASSATIKTSSSSSKIVVGKTFTVTVKVSSSVALGSWEYTINYDSSIISLQSGTKSVADYGNGSKTSATYTYTFKAIKSGSSSIGVKSYGVIDWNESSMSVTTSSSKVTVITQSQLEASYSKDNNLSSLSVQGYELSPAFSKDTTDYTVDLGPEVTSINISASKSDSDASVSGTGTFEVIEGQNKFNIVVTAENGSTKTYKLTANVTDPSPINVTTIDGKEMTIIKRSSVLTAPENYTLETITINDQEIPAFINEITKFTLVGLKDTDGNVGLYIYLDDTYTKYVELKLNNLTLYLSNVNSDEMFGYKKTTLKINEETYNVYKYTESSNFAIIKATDVETGEHNYYMYDIKNNTVTLYNNEQIENLENTLKTYYIVIITLCVETALLFTTFIYLLIRKMKKNNFKKRKIEEAKSKDNETDLKLGDNNKNEKKHKSKNE